MFFVPYRFDLRLKRIPVLTIFVSLICVAIYSKQFANETEFAQKTEWFCSKSRSHVAKLALEKSVGDASPGRCVELMYELGVSDTPEDIIGEYANNSRSFAGLSEEDSKLYIRDFLLDEYRRYRLRVPPLTTKELWYAPESWNPATMVTSSFSHGSWDHLIGNLIFFYAFAAAVELIVGPLAFFMPTAKVRCFYWFLIKIGTVAISAWILALVYIGLDLFTLLTQDEMGGINLVAHISGAMIGFFLGMVFFRRHRREIAID